MGTPQFRNLVFEGGGVRGIAYVGAMEVLAQRGLLDHITRVGGTSAGAINALIHALGFDLDSQHAILDSTDFRRLGAKRYVRWWLGEEAEPANRIA